MRTLFEGHLFTSSVIGVCALSGAAWAAEPAAGGVATRANSSDMLEEIIVTAQKREQNVETVPISMTVLSGRQIEAFHENDLHSLENSVPNLYIERLNWADTIYLRGFGSPPANYAFDPDVSLYVDGVYSGRPQQFGAPFFDVERVEVLRGPQGALFGKNTAAGAISIVTANPTTTFAAAATGSYNFELRGTELSAFASGPLSSDLAARLAVKLLNFDGYIDNRVTGDRNPRRQEALARLSLRYQPSNDLDLTGKLEYSRRETDGENAVLASLTVPNEVTGDQFTPGTTFGFRDAATVTSTNGSVTGNWRLGADTLTFVSGYSHFKADRANTYSRDNPQWFTNLTLENFKQFSQEVRLTSPEHQTIDYIVGGYFDWGKYEVGTPWHYNLFGGAVAGSLDTNFAQTVHTYSAFGQATYNITDAARLIGSLRYTKVDKTGSLATVLVTGIPIAGLTADSADISENHVDPSVTAQYDLASQVMLYATYGQGSKSGGFVSNTPGTTQPNFAFAPEKAKSYEFGIKSSFADNKLLADVSLYHTRIEDLQTSVFDSKQNGGFITKNAGSATARGVEASLGWRPIQALQLSWSGAYLDAKYDSFKGANCLARQALSLCDTTVAPAAPNSVANNDLAGYPLTYASKWTGVATAQHQLPITDQYVLTSTLRAAYRSRFYNSDDQSLIYGVQSGFVKYDLRFELGNASGGWAVALLGKNIADKRTYSFANAWVVTATPTAIKYLDEPRTITLEATVRF